MREQTEELIVCVWVCKHLSFIPKGVYKKRQGRHFWFLTQLISASRLAPQIRVGCRTPVTDAQVCKGSTKGRPSVSWRNHKKNQCSVPLRRDFFGLFKAVMISVINLFCMQFFNLVFRNRNFPRVSRVGSTLAPHVLSIWMEWEGERGRTLHPSEITSLDETFWFFLLKSYLLCLPFLLGYFTGVKVDLVENLDREL